MFQSDRQDVCPTIAFAPNTLMKTIIPLFLFVLFVPLGGQSLFAKDNPPVGYTSLFNGKDLTHWKIHEGDNGQSWPNARLPDWVLGKSGS